MEWQVTHIIIMKNNLQWYSSVCICIRPVFRKKRKIIYMCVLCVYSVSASDVGKWRHREMNAQRYMF